MLSQFRLVLCAAIAFAAVWTSAALAQWPGSHVARLEPGYRGVCEDCDLSGRILAGARMMDSVFDGSDFSHAVLTRADASRSSFESVDFTGADLTRAKLVGARCADAVFEDAVLMHTDARQADFSRATFTRARLDGANFSGADLRRARGLTQAQLNRACGNGETLLPRGLRVRTC